MPETFAAFEELRAAGKIRHYGVSNFDVDDLDELEKLVPENGCAANQVMYNLSDRGIEWDLYPKCRKDKIAVMAYCPLGQGRLINNPGLEPIAKKHKVTNAAIALAFTLRLPGMISIPKSSHEKRVLENAVAADLALDEEDLANLNKSFLPRGKNVRWRLLELAVLHSTQPVLALNFSQVVRTPSLTCPHSLAATSQLTMARDVLAVVPLATVDVAIES